MSKRFVNEIIMIISISKSLIIKGLAGLLRANQKLQEADRATKELLEEEDRKRNSRSKTGKERRRCGRRKATTEQDESPKDEHVED